MNNTTTRTCETAQLHFTPDSRGLCGFHLDLQLQMFEVVENSQKNSVLLNMELKFH